MAKFRKGEKRPAGAGRKKGSTNKATRETKEALNDFIQNHQDNIKEWFDQLDSADKKLTYFIKLLEFTTPKQKAVEATHNINQDSGIKLVIEKTYDNDEEG